MEIRIVKLKKNFAQQHIQKLLSFTEDQPWESWTTENFLQDMPGKWERSLCALISDIPVGYIIVSEKADSIHIHHIAVQKEYRRHFIGYLLMRKLEEDLLSQQLSLPLTLKVFHLNDAAKNFYRSLSFEEALKTQNQEFSIFRKESKKIKKIKYAVHQPNFLPWLGYFAKLQAVDAFIFLDDVQMPIGRSYVSRTMIRNSKQNEDNKSQWLTVPVRKKFEANINEIQIADDEDWRSSHLSKISQIYKKSPYYNDTMEFLKNSYKSESFLLKDLNVFLIKSISNELGLKTKFLLSSQFNLKTASDQRIIDLGKIIQASEYVSGKGGENYQLLENFENNNIALNVTSYPEQIYDSENFPFCYGLSVIDAFFIYGAKNVRELLKLNYKF